MKVVKACWGEGGGGGGGGWEGGRGGGRVRDSECTSVTARLESDVFYLNVHKDLRARALFDMNTHTHARKCT